MISRMRWVVVVMLIGVSLQGCAQKTSLETIASVPTGSSAPFIEQAPPAAPSLAEKPTPTGPFKTFPIYTDAKSPDNHYTPSGWMGDYGDLRLDDKFMQDPHSGSTSIKISYSPEATQGARWAGVYWQNPPNNWGARPGGYDLTGAKKVTFWARGEKGGERIEEFKIGGITGEYADSDVAGIGPVELTTEWQQYTIDLDGKDLSSISGGFCWATNLDANPQGAVFYLDDIRYE